MSRKNIEIQVTGSETTSTIIEAMKNGSQVNLIHNDDVEGIVINAVTTMN